MLIGHSTFVTSRRPSSFVAAAALTLLAVSSVPAATATNGFYVVTVSDAPGGPGVGVYTAQTDVLHPVTAALGQQNVLFGGGSPSRSWTSIHSYTSSTTYSQRGSQVLQAGAPAPVLLEGFVVPGEAAVPVGTDGFMTHYRLSSTGGGAGDDLDIFQTVRAEGSVFNDSAVELSTQIFNLGASAVQIGIRYFLDFQIGGGDDGPNFQLRDPDGPVEVLEADYFFPAATTFEVIDNNDPSDFVCSLGPTNTPFPLFGVGGSVRGPASLQPTAPTTLQFVSWPHVSGLPAKLTNFAAQDAFFYSIGPLDAASCVVSHDDSAANYFWGETQGDSFTIGPGQSAMVTAYLFAFLPGQQPTFPVSVENCEDGLDNDGDGLVDGDDPDCSPLVVDLASFEVESTRRGILVSWKTASEIDNAGFQLLRGPSPAGPWLPLNHFLIPGKGSSVSGASYEFLDRATRKAVFYYKLVDFDLSGLPTEHGPVAARWGKTASARQGRIR